MESMDITIEDSDILARICKDVNLTPKKLFEDYIASLTHLYYTYEKDHLQGGIKYCCSMQIFETWFGIAVSSRQLVG